MVRLMVSGWPISDKWQRTCGILQISWYQHTIENLYGLWKMIEKKNLSTPKNHPKSISKGNLLDNWWQTKAINTWMARSNLYVALLSTSTSFFLHSLSFLFAAHSALSLRSSCIWSGSKSSRSSGLCIYHQHSIKKSKPLHLQSINAQMHGVHCT